jgi:D-cysteine desulfhydrase
LGAIGYVNAAFELAAQVRAGLLREPDVIYVPMGSMGTCAGLALGLEAVGLRSRVFAVRVIERRWAGVAGLRKLLDGTAALLRKCEPGFPDLAGARDRLVVRDEFLGDGYAHFTRKGVAAAELLYGEAGIVMNGSYSAKAFAAMLDDAAQSRMGDKTVLFWNTYNSRDVAGFAAGVDHRHLTGAFVRYFEDDVQPLDRDGIDR